MPLVTEMLLGQSGLSFFLFLKLKTRISDSSCTQSHLGLNLSDRHQQGMVKRKTYVIAVIEGPSYAPKRGISSM